MNSQQQIINPEKETIRILKGHEIYKSGLIEKINDHEFLVKNQYQVKDIGDIEPIFTCTCPDFTYRADNINYCKHIYSIIFYIMNN